MISEGGFSFWPQEGVIGWEVSPVFAPRKGVIGCPSPDFWSPASGSAQSASADGGPVSSNGAGEHRGAGRTGDPWTSEPGARCGAQCAVVEGVLLGQFSLHIDLRSMFSRHQLTVISGEREKGGRQLFAEVSPQHYFTVDVQGHVGSYDMSDMSRRIAESSMFANDQVTSNWRLGLVVGFGTMALGVNGGHQP